MLRRLRRHIRAYLVVTMLGLLPVAVCAQATTGDPNTSPPPGARVIYVQATIGIPDLPLKNVNGTAQCLASNGPRAAFGVVVENTQAAVVAYVALYDSLAPTVGTNALRELIVPANSMAYFPDVLPGNGLKFAVGVCAASTTTSQVTGGTTGSANGVHVFITSNK